MTSESRAALEELASAVDHGDTQALATAMAAARAALTESVSVVPSDKEIMALMPSQMHEDLAAAARAMAGFDSPNAAMGAIRNILNRHAVDHARAVLDRWGSAN